MDLPGKGRWNRFCSGLGPGGSKRVGNQVSTESKRERVQGETVVIGCHLGFSVEV